MIYLKLRINSPPNSIFVHISKYCQPTFRVKRSSRHQSKGEKHAIEKVYEWKDLFSRRVPNVGFIFAFYHHTYPGGKQKESNKSETLKLWRQERNIFPNAEVNIDFLTEKIKFWTQISMKVPKREIFFSFFISMFPIPPSFHESYI